MINFYKTPPEFLSKVGGATHVCEHVARSLSMGQIAIKVGDLGVPGDGERAAACPACAEYIEANQPKELSESERPLNTEIGINEIGRSRVKSPEFRHCLEWVTRSCEQALAGGMPCDYAFQAIRLIGLLFTTIALCSPPDNGVFVATTPETLRFMADHYDEIREAAAAAIRELNDEAEAKAAPEAVN